MDRRSRLKAILLNCLETILWLGLGVLAGRWIIIGIYKVMGD